MTKNKAVLITGADGHKLATLIFDRSTDMVSLNRSDGRSIRPSAPAATEFRGNMPQCSRSILRLAESDLARSGIIFEQAETAGFFPVDNANTINLDFATAPGIIIPYYDEAGRSCTYLRDGRTLQFCRVRYLAAPGFQLPRGRKYDQPGDSGSQLYIPRSFDHQAAKKGGIVITEGEKKALALCLAGIPAIGIGGVWNFGGEGAPLHPALSALIRRYPEAFIVFDSDAATKPDIQNAEWRLAGQIALSGGRPHVVRVPPETPNEKTGADDYLVKHGAKALSGLIQSAPALGNSALTNTDDAITIADLLKRKVKEVEELIPGWVEKGIPNFLAGPGGVHKSRLALQWALCLNAGAPIWAINASIVGINLPKVTMVFCSAEDDADELTRRATAISSTLKLRTTKNGIVLPCSGKDCALAVMGESGKVEVRPFYHELLARLRAIPGHKIVVLDSAYDFVRFIGRAKIDEDSVNYFIKVMLQRICNDGDCTLLIPWHPSQAGSERASMDGWSVAWHNAPRARLALKADPGSSDIYQLGVAKRNHGPAGQTLKLRFHNGALLPLAALPDDGKDAAFRRCVVEEAIAGARAGVPLTRQRRIPEKVLASISTTSGVEARSHRVKDELDSAVRDGELQYISGNNKFQAGYYPPDNAEAIELARRNRT